MARELRVHITIVGDDHRIHVTGEPAVVSELASRGRLTLFNKYQASGSKAGYDFTYRAWALASQRSRAAAQTHSKLKAARDMHLRQFRDCPHSPETRR